MYKRLYRFLEIHKVLYSLQFGFQENHSIDHFLVSLTEAIRNTVDNKDLAVVSALIYKRVLIQLIMHFYYQNWHIMAFVDVFLNGLDHIYLIEVNVSVGGSNSKLLSITCGVPQGSVLGPLPFLIYINDLSNTSEKVKFHLFADDTNIYFESSDLSNVIKIVSRELRSVKK